MQNLTRYQVWLDEHPLHELDPTIYITDIQEQAPRMAVATAPRALGDGLHLIRRTRQSLSVAVRFAIREYDTARRKAIMQKIHAWAKAGKYLSISDRPGQRLHVTVDAVPTIASALKWTEEMTIIFTAYALPFWEEAIPVQTTGGAVFVPGDADRAPVDVTIANCPATLTLTVGGTCITLRGLTAGATLALTHDSGMLRITCGGASVMDKRTPESADDLWAIPGQVNAFTASGGQAVFSIRGVWL